MDGYLLTATDIAAMAGTDKVHFLNDNARRNNKSLGDATGLTGLGVHLIEVPASCESTEFHVHSDEDECTYVLEGQGEVEIGDTRHPIGPGDFIGYRAGGRPHSMHNTGTTPLRCLVIGQRLAHDVGDYPRLGKRIYRRQGHAPDLVDTQQISHPVMGGK